MNASRQSPAALDRQAAFSGTQEVAANFRFDASALERYLVAQIPGFRSPIALRQFRGGQSNPTYLVETSERRYVLRRRPPGKLLPSAHAVDREFRVISALHPQGFPVPEPIHYCPDDSVIGTAFYLMSHVEGRVIWVPEVPASNPAERAAIYDVMNRTLATLHAFDPVAIGLGDYGKGESYVARQVARWTKQYLASKTEEIPEMDRLIAWLPEHLPEQSAVRLVHGDYRLDNIILATSSPDVLAVIDWELSTLGDPLADFTYHLMAWHMPTAESGTGTGSLVGQDLAQLGIPSADTYIESYAARTGLDPLPFLDVYLAYNFFRVAAILQGILGRVRDGTAANANAATMSRQVRPLAQVAWSFAERLRA